MRHLSEHRRKGRQSRTAPAPLVLNGFRLRFEKPLAIPVTLFELQKLDKKSASGTAVNAMWVHRTARRDLCPGSGFIVGVTDTVVAVSRNWDLPSGVAGGFDISRKAQVTASPEGNGQQILVAIVRDALKKHLKEAGGHELGPLWRDYGDICQMPSDEHAGEFFFCRKILVRPKLLSGEIAIQVGISTVTLDRLSIGEHFKCGHFSRIADLVDAQQSRYAKRTGETADFRIWYDHRPGGGIDAEVVQLSDPQQLAAMAKSATPPTNAVDCISFPDKKLQIPLDRLHLIAGSWSSAGQHRHTILSPNERAELRDKVADLLHGFPIHNTTGQLSETPISLAGFNTLSVLPPRIVVRDEWEQPRIIPAPAVLDAESLLRRSRQRQVAVGRHGFLRPSPIKPLLAWPSQVYTSRGSFKAIDPAVAKAMQRTLNSRLLDRKINAHFEVRQYQSPVEIRQYIEASGHDALFAVLPEPSGHPYSNADTHESIKQAIHVPSQCIHWNNTLGESVSLKPLELHSDDDKKQERRAVQRYDLCIDNLLAKCGWLPFITADPFRFNVHVGIDVGGKNNDTVVVSLCHGLGTPQQEVAFRVERIRVDALQAEPIPSHSLALGIQRIIEFVHSELSAANLRAGFEDVLFFRDGAMLGKGDQWNERDGLVQLRLQLINSGLIQGTGVWAVAEAHKRSEAWRIEARRDGRHENPVVGQCVVGLECPNEALVCTTGQPFLTQGTAKPTIVLVDSICGEVDMESVLYDYMWEADMGFTKLDVAHSLPWILRIADSGAHQLSRNYTLAGITM